MGVSNQREVRAERNRGYAEVPLNTVIPRAGNTHLQQNPILESFSCKTPPKKLKRIYVVCLGKNTSVRWEFLSQAKTTDFFIWCARNQVLMQCTDNLGMVSHCI